MSLIAVIGVLLIVLALLKVIPLVLGLILGIVLIIAGGGFYYRGRRNRL